ncbi:MAG: prolipoprotein diacylglyceryl transferase [Myxococcales bacterium]|nr:prolipoprotein diacylglyceryl transferase [Myxococcales bacterium]USN51753.1 MAG: prolipoprotein diacylglyceryl transferase [Myxococcales bacterium]
MLPELFRIPFLDLPVHTYGALYVLGLIAGTFVAYRQALLGKKYHNDIVDYAFWALVGALLGARVLFIIVESHYYFVEQPFTEIPALGISIPTIFALWKGGFVFWGGAVGGALALVIFCKKRKLPMAEMADFCAPGLAIGHAIGRLGCVAGGCCFGNPVYHLDQAGNVIADVPFALAFPPGSIAFSSLYNQASGETLTLMKKIGTTLPLFPVQLVESFGNIAIFFILMLLIPMKRAHGQITLLYFILYSIMRSLTETLRGDTARGFVIENVLSTSQFISILMSTAAIILMVLLSRRSKQLSLS